MVMNGKINKGRTVNDIYRDILRDIGIVKRNRIRFYIVIADTSVRRVTYNGRACNGFGSCAYGNFGVHPHLP